MTIKHESLHFALIEDTTSTASKLSLKELKPAKSSKKAIKGTVEEAESITPYHLEIPEREEELAIVTGPSDLFDDPEAYDVW